MMKRKKESKHKNGHDRLYRSRQATYDFLRAEISMAPPGSDERIADLAEYYAENTSEESPFLPLSGYVDPPTAVRGVPNMLNEYDNVWQRIAQRFGR